MSAGSNAGRTLVGVNGLNEALANFGAEAAGSGDVLAISAGGTGASTAADARATLGVATFPISFYQNGTMSDAQPLLRFPAPVAFSFPAAFAGSTISIGTSASTSRTFAVLKAGVGIGTVTVSSASVAVFTLAATTSFAINDVLTVTAPATADSTLAGVGLALLATRA